MSELPDPHQRTEEPTAKRLEEARRKGDAPRSPEIAAALSLAAAGLSLWLLAPAAAQAIAAAGAAFLDHPHAIAADGAALARLFGALALTLAAAVAGIAALLTVAGLAANLAQARPVLVWSRVKPSWKRLSPIEGAKRVFGPAALVNLAKGIGKIAIVGAILSFALIPDQHRLAAVSDADARSALSLAQIEILKLIAYSLAALAVIAALDYAWARREWRRRLRMTREEVRREWRESEGDPQIKGRQRQIRETRARRRMMAAVKDATVLLMNPAHYAVALKYEPDRDRAPLCVAKGLDEIALRLRAEAERAGVPVIENPPLARALYGAVEIDEEIPVEHYEAVAKVIGFVMGPRRTVLPGGATRRVAP
jgi:flagellar biosynthetic protein FlhB